MNVKQNLDKTVTKAKCKAAIMNPTTQQQIGKLAMNVQVSLPSGHKIELNRENLIEIGTTSRMANQYQSISHSDLD